MKSSSTEYLQFVDQMLAEDTNCSPPCWQGLMPGVATKADVLTALTEISFVNQEYIIQQEPSHSEFSFVRWVNTAPQSLSISGTARFDNENLLVAIQFTADFDHPLRSFGTIIETFGEPDFYFVAASHNYACKRDILIWLDEGLEIMTYPELAGEDGPAINEDTPIHSIVYFIPQHTVESYLRNIVGLSESEIQERLPRYQQWDEHTRVESDGNSG